MEDAPIMETNNKINRIVLLLVAPFLFFAPSAFAQTEKEITYKCGSRIAPSTSGSAEGWRSLQKDANMHNSQVDACINNLANQAAYDAIPPGAAIPGMLINGRAVYKCSSGLPCIGRIMREAGVK